MVALCASVAAVLGPPAAAQAATPTVFNVNDVNDAAWTGSAGECVSSDPSPVAPVGVTAGECTLRAALQAASALTTDVTVVVPAGDYVLSRAQASGPRVDDGSIGNLVVSDSPGVQRTVTITGAGAGATVIDGGARQNGGTWSAGNGDRVLDIAGDGTPGDLTVGLSGVTIEGGNLQSVAGCLDLSGGGVVVAGDANATIDDSAITGNAVGTDAQFADRDGGGVGVQAQRTCAAAKSDAASASAPATGDSTVIVTDSTIAGNFAGRNGGGFAGSGVGNYTFTGDTFAANTAGAQGGAYFGTEFETFDDSDDTASLGSDVATLLNDTITGNIAGTAGSGAGGDGGGIALESESAIPEAVTAHVATPAATTAAVETASTMPTATFEHVTINANSAAGAGGNISAQGGGVTLLDTIVAGGTETDSGQTVGVTPQFELAANCDISFDGSIQAGADNLFDDSGADCNAGPSDITGPAAGVGLQPLGNYGGPTETEALVADSPAVGAADPARCASVAVDQRGDGRAANCDIGAFELAADVGVTGSASPAPGTVGSPVTTPTTVTTSTTSTTPAPQGAVKAATTTVPPHSLLPAVRACTSRRLFVVHIQNVAEQHIVSAVIYVNGHKEQVVRSHLSGPVDLRNLPYGTFVVRIDARQSDGHVLRGTRTYHTCRAHRLPGHKFLPL